MSTFETEVKAGQRFEFGKNWHSFLATLTDERIEVAKQSILEMLGVDNLKGKRFLDIGSGSGLFSLAARKLGAEVNSFDYDPASVACTEELRTRYFPNDQNWVVQEGSVLDKEYLKSLGIFDIVYSWGVLHHTGNMWAALENAASLVKKDGIFFIGIYNDQGSETKLWRRIKKTYCSGILGKAIISCIFIPYLCSRVLIAYALGRKNIFAKYKKSRGMSITHDWFDWLGGFPFEVAKVEEIFHFARDRGFVLANIVTTFSHGINQFVFTRESDA